MIKWASNNVSVNIRDVYFRWTGITNQQAEMINSTYKSNDVYSRVDTLKSDSNLNTLPFTRKSTDTDFLSSFTWQHNNFYAPVTPS